MGRPAPHGDGHPHPLLIARLVRGGDGSDRSSGPAQDWLSSCIAASAIVAVGVSVAVGFPAGAAAVYDGHHGTPLGTVTAINDIRNFAFFLTGGLDGLFALGVAAAALVTGQLPRWVAYSGIVVGVLYLAAIPAAGTGILNVVTLLGFVWLAALGVAALRRGSRLPARALGRTETATA